MTTEVAVLKAPAAHTLAQLADRARTARQGGCRARDRTRIARARDGGCVVHLDLVVALETPLPITERWKALRDLLDALPLPVDLLVYTPAEFARGMADRVRVFDAIARDGVEIHARPAS